MRARAAGLAFAAALAAGGAFAEPASLTVDQLLAVCESRSIAAATAKGDALQWSRAPVSRLADWRGGFQRFNRARARVVGWRRTAATGDSQLSWWIARGADALRGCAYSTAEGGEWLAALQARLGEPDVLEKVHPSVVATWTRGSLEVNFTQVASTIYVAIAHRR